MARAGRVARGGHRIGADVDLREEDQLSRVDLEHTDFDEHKAIADALLARNPEEAAKAASAHVQSSLKNMSKLERIWHHRRAVGSG